VKDRQGEVVPPPVPAGDRPGGEVHGRWPWVERSVWTERMLETLERGPRNGVWHSLIDKVYAERTLWAAWEQVRSNGGVGGVDHETIGGFGRTAEKNIGELSCQLREGRYVPRPVKRVMIPKPGTTQERPLGIPTIRDRVVQTALRMVLEPIFERDFARESYGFRPGRSCQQALERVETLLAEGYTHVVDTVHSVIPCTSASDDDDPWLTYKVIFQCVGAAGLVDLFLKLGVF